MSLLGGILEGVDLDWGIVAEMIADGPGGWTGSAGAGFALDLGSRISFAFEVAGVLGLSEPSFNFGEMSLDVFEFAEANGLTVLESLPDPAGSSFEATVGLGLDPVTDGWVRFHYNGPGDYGIDFVAPIPGEAWDFPAA